MPSSDTTPEPGRRSGQGADSARQQLEVDNRRKTEGARGAPIEVTRAAFKILVVDDLEGARYAIVRTLRAAGYAAVDAGTGLEALSMAPQVAAIVLDIHLPDIDGIEVCQRIREQPTLAKLPVIHVSAARLTNAQREAVSNSGANVFLEVPVDPERLVTELDRMLIPAER